MKKAILIGSVPPPYGGVASWTLRYINAELKNDWKIELVSDRFIGKRDTFGDNVKRNYFFEALRCMRIWRDLNRALKDKEALVVHTAIPAYTLSMCREYFNACIAKKHNKPFVLHFRCTVPNITKSKFSVFILKKLCNKSTRIISLNSQTTSFLNTITETPVILIPNYIDQSEIMDNKLIQETLSTVLYVGGVTIEKGCDTIIEVAKNFPKIQFRLVGNPEASIKEQAKDIDNVVLCGSKNGSEVKEELSKADLFMFLSHYSGEGFSNALLEAMAAGLPCIVSDWAANADMIGKMGGQIVPCCVIEETCRALETEKSYELRKSQSYNNIQKIKTNYMDKVVIDQYIDCYEDCLGMSKK